MDYPHDKAPAADPQLHEIARLARRGREFFTAEYPRLDDPELRLAFAYANDVKQRLIAELEPWLGGAEGGHRSALGAAVEKTYADARTALRMHAPARLGAALGFAEDRLLRLLESARDQAGVPALKRLLASYCAPLRSSREAFWRVTGRRAA